MRYAFTLLVFVSALACSFVARAESLSDLDWDNFQKQRGQYQVQTTTDPFASGVSSADDLTIEELQLTGIVFRDDLNSYALISGYLVRPSDRIAGYRVEKIERDRVRLVRLDEVYILSLGGGM